MRKFDTGATRDTDEGKYVYGGFLSPLVLERFSTYMHEHRVQADGGLRAADNWKKGMPLDAYFQSTFRHFMDWWFHHDGLGQKAQDTLENTLCAVIFNVQGYLHEVIRAKLESKEPSHETDATRPCPSGPWRGEPGTCP